MSTGSIILVFAGLLLIILSVAVFIPMGRAFVYELRYINMKIMSSRHDQEQAYWERRKKQLWLSLLPFRHYDRHGHHHHK